MNLSLIRLTKSQKEWKTIQSFFISPFKIIAMLRKTSNFVKAKRFKEETLDKAASIFDLIVDESFSGPEPELKFWKFFKIFIELFFELEYIFNGVDYLADDESEEEDIEASEESAGSSKHGAGELRARENHNISVHEKPRSYDQKDESNNRRDGEAYLKGERFGQNISRGRLDPQIETKKEQFEDLGEEDDQQGRRLPDHLKERDSQRKLVPQRQAEPSKFENYPKERRVNEEPEVSQNQHQARKQVHQTAENHYESSSEDDGEEEVVQVIVEVSEGESDQVDLSTGKKTQPTPPQPRGVVGKHEWVDVDDSTPPPKKSQKNKKTSQFERSEINREVNELEDSLRSPQPALQPKNPENEGKDSLEGLMLQETSEALQRAIAGSKDHRVGQPQPKDSQETVFYPKNYSERQNQKEDSVTSESSPGTYTSPDRGQKDSRMTSSNHTSSEFNRLKKIIEESIDTQKLDILEHNLQLVCSEKPRKHHKSPETEEPLVLAKIPKSPSVHKSRSDASSGEYLDNSSSDGKGLGQVYKNIRQNIKKRKSMKKEFTKSIILSAVYKDPNGGIVGGFGVNLNTNYGSNFRNKSIKADSNLEHSNRLKQLKSASSGSSGKHNKPRRSQNEEYPTTTNIASPIPIKPTSPMQKYRERKKKPRRESSNEEIQSANKIEDSEKITLYDIERSISVVESDYSRSEVDIKIPRREGLQGSDPLPHSLHSGSERTSGASRPISEAFTSESSNLSNDVKMPLKRVKGRKKRRGKDQRAQESTLERNRKALSRLIENTEIERTELKSVKEEREEELEGARDSSFEGIERSQRPNDSSFNSGRNVDFKGKNGSNGDRLDLERTTEAVEGDSRGNAARYRSSHEKSDLVTPDHSEYSGSMTGSKKSKNRRTRAMRMRMTSEFKTKSQKSLVSPSTSKKVISVYQKPDLSKKSPQSHDLSPESSAKEYICTISSRKPKTKKLQISRNLNKQALKMTPERPKNTQTIYRQTPDSSEIPKKIEIESSHQKLPKNSKKLKQRRDRHKALTLGMKSPVSTNLDKNPITPPLRNTEAATTPHNSAKEETPMRDIRIHSPKRSTTPGSDSKYFAASGLGDNKDPENRRTSDFGLGIQAVEAKGRVPNRQEVVKTKTNFGGENSKTRVNDHQKYDYGSNSSSSESSVSPEVSKLRVRRAEKVSSNFAQKEEKSTKKRQKQHQRDQRDKTRIGIEKLSPSHNVPEPLPFPQKLDDFRPPKGGKSVQSPQKVSKRRSRGYKGHGTSGKKGVGGSSQKVSKLRKKIVSDRNEVVRELNKRIIEDLKKKRAKIRTKHF